jgi:hypothetical protein
VTLQRVAALLTVAKNVRTLLLKCAKNASLRKFRPNKKLRILRITKLAVLWKYKFLGGLLRPTGLAMM